jgi:hypothetical protein
MRRENRSTRILVSGNPGATSHLKLRFLLVLSEKQPSALVLILLCTMGNRGLGDYAAYVLLPLNALGTHGEAPVYRSRES